MLEYVYGIQSHIWQVWYSHAFYLDVSGFCLVSSALNFSCCSSKVVYQQLFKLPLRAGNCSLQHETLNTFNQIKQVLQFGILISPCLVLNFLFFYSKYLQKLSIKKSFLLQTVLTYNFFPQSWSGAQLFPFDQMDSIAMV